MAEEGQAYNLWDPEDMFHCVDVLTKARTALSPIDPNLASEMTKITEALMLIAESEPPGTAANAAALADAMDYSAQKNAPPPVDDDAIVDVLTGRVIGTKR